jgi:hypothetical protein
VTSKDDADRVVLMNDPIIATAEYNKLPDSIKRTLAIGQLRAAQAVNNALVETYRQIGQGVVGRQRERDPSKALTDNLIRFLCELGNGFAFVGAEVPILCGDREFFVDLLFYHCRLHRFMVLELKLGRFESEHVGKLTFYVHLVDDHLRDQARDDPTLGMLLVVGREDVTVENVPRGVSTQLAVTEWPRLPAKVRQALPTAEDFRPTVAQTFREIESAPPSVLRRARSASSWPQLPFPRRAA